MNKKQSTKQAALFFDTFTISEKPIHWKFEPLDIWCKTCGDELWVAFHYRDTLAETTQNNETIPEDISWSRFVFKQKELDIRLSPNLPDRPVVVQPEHPFKIIQGGKARIYVCVPVWIGIEQAKKSSNLLMEIPTRVLSKTWFGSVTEGERCYWLSSPAKNELDEDQTSPFNVICPIQIINSSDGELNVEKLALRVTRLSIFSHNGQLWSDESRITYRGTGDVSRITVSGKAPAEIAGALMLNTARSTSSSWLAAKTFNGLKELSSFLMHL